MDHKKIQKLDQLVKNEVIPKPDISISVQEEKGQGKEPSVLNITETMLRKLLLRYNIAPGTASHIRGQEQVFGSKWNFDEDGKEESLRMHIVSTGFDIRKRTDLRWVEFWYAIRARAYFRTLREGADLKITVITQYDVKTRKTVILLKYRSYNDLPSSFQEELIEKLEELVKHTGTQYLADNPFSLLMFHFSSTIQYYRRGARDPRDTIRKQEERAHDNLDDVNLRMVHLLLGSLDQDKVQLNFILELISRLREQHEYFYKRIKKITDPDDRDWLYIHVKEKFDRFENHLSYLRNSVKDVAGKAQRLLDLVYRISKTRDYSFLYLPYLRRLTWKLDVTAIILPK